MKRGGDSWEFGVGSGRPPGFWRRVLENPENPLGWSTKLFTVRAVAVRIHLFTIAYLLGQLLWCIPESHGGFLFVAPGVVALFVLVLLHELGHCAGCRWMGGEADRVVLLPWGGLALCRPPGNWKAHLVTAACGPLVNAAIVPLTSAALLALGLRDAILFDPFHPLSTLILFPSAGGDVRAFARICLWWMHYVNIVLLAFNLLPVFPFDGGRIVHALLWRRIGAARASHVAAITGLGGAMMIGVLSLLIDKAMLVTVAVIGGWSSWMELRRARGEVDLVSGEFPLPAPQEQLLEAEAAEEKARQRERASREEIDRILAKIKEKGMGSLSKAERRALDAESKRAG